MYVNLFIATTFDYFDLIKMIDEQNICLLYCNLVKLFMNDPIYYKL